MLLPQERQGCHPPAPAAGSGHRGLLGTAGGSTASACVRNARAHVGVIGLQNVTSKTSFDARIKQRFLGTRGSAADAVFASGKAVGREQQCSAAFRGVCMFSVPVQNGVYMKYCALEETCISCPLDMP